MANFVLLYSGGSAGRTEAERKQVMEVAGKNKDGMNIICSSGTSNFTETIELSKHAADHGAEGLLVIPPFYYKKPELAGLVKYYSLLFDAVPQSLAVNLYHIPSNSAVPISHDLLKALKHYPNLAGIKDSEEDMPEYKQFVAAFPDLNMRTGTDTKLEFGYIDGQIHLIDECFTPDSSRYWDAETYERGKPQPSMDKQFLRDWLSQLDWDKTSPGPELPEDVILGTRDRYLLAYRRVTGQDLELGAR